MGTNFYGRIIPTKERKQELKNIIDSDDFSKITEEISKTYAKIDVDWEGNICGGEVHLGKRSAGWKFLWNPNIYIIRHGHSVPIKIDEHCTTYKWVKEPNTYCYVYPLTKKGIKEFIDREDVEIYDEYGEKQDKETFFKEALEWTTWKGEEAWDSASYEEFEKKENPKYHPYNVHGEYIDALKSLGYKMISESHSDFYSDGLRFSTTTDFS